MVYSAALTSAIAHFH
ncbi:hypothetical protein ACQSFF_20700 [Salmonella enterica]